MARRKNLPAERNEHETELMEQEERTLTPRVDIFENDEEFLIVADMPGVPKDAMEVTFEKDSIVITGTKAEPEEEWQPTTIEYATGKYYRAFRLPSDIDTSKIKAEYKEGVLTIHLPKSDETKAHRITVKSK